MRRLFQICELNYGLLCFEEEITRFTKWCIVQKNVAYYFLDVLAASLESPLIKESMKHDPIDISKARGSYRTMRFSMGSINPPSGLKR